MVPVTKCWTSRSTADLLTVVSYRIARAFNRPKVTGAVALEIWRADLLHKLTSYRMLS